jgi:hypothetical protein
VKEPAVHLTEPTTAAATAYVLIHLVRAARDITIVWITVNRVDPRSQKAVLSVLHQERSSGDPDHRR